MNASDKSLFLSAKFTDDFKKKIKQKYKKKNKKKIS